MIKTYVINLPRSPERRENVLAECARFNIEPEIVGVDGQKFTEAELRELVYAPDKSPLSRPEIGCALSHRTVYADMVEKNIPIALVLEDDVGFAFDPRPLLKEFSKLPHDAPTVYLLKTDQLHYTGISAKQIGNVRFFQILNGWFTAAYIINRLAALKILHFQSPVKVEADNWDMFLVNGLITRLYACEKEIINHQGKFKSTIRADPDFKSSSEIKKKEYFSHLKKLAPFHVRIKNYWSKRVYVLFRALSRLLGKGI